MGIFVTFHMFNPTNCLQQINNFFKGFATFQTCWEKKNSE